MMAWGARSPQHKSDRCMRSITHTCRTHAMKSACLHATAATFSTRHLSQTEERTPLLAFFVGMPCMGHELITIVVVCTTVHCPTAGRDGRSQRRSVASRPLG